MSGRLYVVVQACVCVCDVFNVWAIIRLGKKLALLDPEMCACQDVCM